MSDVNPTAPEVKPPTVHVLPPGLGRLAAHAGTEGRFALGAVQVRFPSADTFVAEATDTKHLVRIEGPTVVPAAEFPDVPGLSAAPNGAAKALVPATSWAKAFKSATSIKCRGSNKALGAVACVTGTERTTFAATNLEQFVCETTFNVTGKFPDSDTIVSKTVRETKGGAGVAKVAFDPKLLIDILRTAETALGDIDNRVEMSFPIDKDGKPTVKAVLITAQNNTDGRKMTALLMPLS
ncbi:MAG TPA: hypothetical protein VGE74_09705 [Gemmata sp.]